MLSVCIFGNDRKNHLTIERTDIDRGDQSFDVSVVQSWFRGTAQMWSGEIALQQFVAELRECERLRRGEANLNAMSPQSFTLRIFNTRLKGDFSLAYEINNYQCSLTGEFELDPSMLLQILRDFEALIHSA